MKILVLTLEQSKIKQSHLLDWLTGEENKAGVNTESHWMMNTNVNIDNQHNDYEVAKLIGLLHLSQIHGYSQVMIKKDV